ncbi:hypothetical protein ENH_00014010 [Eimeria necatrix]|uniref:Uncharacterized protein n=1 Tax=Eimeria necatrix TaxID=51315 RepID=U6MWJ8_9EIME|nr:hypothetical protein ENH_00014010 [Eimeria necatrix]CDJ66065.1 hypothetical protein ENH_00014010 [Eimeria necatrix]
MSSGSWGVWTAAIPQSENSNAARLQQMLQQLKDASQEQEIEGVVVKP